MTKEQEDQLDERLSEATIISHDFDFFKNQIVFELKYDDTGERHKVIFKNVSAFSFVYDDGDLDNLKLEEWDAVDGRLELTCISFWHKIKADLSGAEWASDCKPSNVEFFTFEQKITGIYNVCAYHLFIRLADLI